MIGEPLAALPVAFAVFPVSRALSAFVTAVYKAQTRRADAYNRALLIRAIAVNKPFVKIIAIFAPEITHSSSLSLFERAASGAGSVYFFAA